MSGKRRVILQTKGIRMLGTGWPADGFAFEVMTTDGLGEPKWDMVGHHDDLRIVLSDALYCALAELLTNGTRVPL